MPDRGASGTNRAAIFAGGKLLAVLALAGTGACGPGGSAPGSDASGVRLIWEPPPARASDRSPPEIANYRIWWSRGAPFSRGTSRWILVGPRTDWVLTDLSPGPYSAAVSAIDRNGREGPLSPEARFEIRSKSSHARGWIGLVLAGLGMTAGGATSASAGAPYPPSPVISGVTWDYPGLTRLAPGSDLWPVTWATDDNVYTSWGDGGGFGGTDSDGRVSLGVGRIQGSPPSITGVNIYGGKNALVPSTIDGKATGILSVGGVLYMPVVDNSTWIRLKMGRSTDLGRTWTFNSATGWDFAEPDGAFSDATLLNFGKDYAGARDGYVYAYSADDRARDVDGVTLTDISMFRAPVAHIMDRSYYEYWAGTSGSGQPVWTSNITLRKPVFVDPNGVGWGTRVMYDPILRRYLLTAWHNQSGGWGIFDAPEPWGPWSTVAYYEGWIDSTFKFGFGLNQKWMSADGLTFYMAFSGTGVYDSFNLIRGTFALAGTPDVTGPSAPSSLRAVAIP